LPGFWIEVKDIMIDRDSERRVASVIADLLMSECTAKEIEPMAALLQCYSTACEQLKFTADGEGSSRRIFHYARGELGGKYKSEAAYRFGAFILTDTEEVLTAMREAKLKRRESVVAARAA
jgi:hypothetical protein